MSLTRLVALGLLTEHGPMHGHELRRAAAARHVESWGGVGPGALYRELHQLEAEGLIELVCTEQVGKRPPRAVYRVTDAGRQALQAHRAEALGTFVRPPDAVGVALLFGGSDDPGELLGALGRRHEAALAALAALVVKWARLEELGVLGAFGQAVFRRAELYLQAELAWHEECLSMLDGETAGDLGTAGAVGGASAVRGAGADGGASAGGDGTGIGPGRRRRAGRASTPGEAGAHETTR